MLLTVALGLVSPLLLADRALVEADAEPNIEAEASEFSEAGAGACSSTLLFSLKSMRFLVFCPEAEVAASSGSVLTLIQDPS